MEIENNLAAIRRKRGLTVAALASQAGVTRQAVYSIEGGSFVPNTQVALRMADVLGVSVEDLFRLKKAPPQPQAARRVEVLSAGETPHAGQPVRLCRVGGRLVATFASPLPSELPAADAVVVRTAGRGGALVEAIDAEDEEAGSRLLIAGCDPGMGVLGRFLARRRAAELIAVGCSSVQALDWLKKKKVHIAGTHLRDEETGESNLPVVRKFFPRNVCRVVTFADWEEGLVARAGNPKGIRGISDLSRADVRFINREPGAGSRFLLDQLLEKAGLEASRVKGYERIARGHIAAAWHVYAGEADCCIAARAASRVFGLDFLPLASERYDLVIPKRFLGRPSVEAMLDAMSRLAFRRELAALGAYDTSHTGSIVI